MRTQSDQIAKTVLSQALELFGTTLVEKEVVAPDAQRIDICHTPGLPRAHVPRHLRLAYRMGRMSPFACLLEPFSQTLGVPVVRNLQRKQLTWHHQLGLRARRERRRAPPLPYLWAISPGRPAGVFRTFDVTPLPGWPRGFYHVGRGYETGLLVVSELPPGVETLLLRLLGRGRTRAEALAELGRLPEDTPELRELRVFVVGLQQIITRDKKISKRDREAFMTAVQAEFLKLQRDLLARGREEGLAEGREEGLAEGLEEGLEEGLRRCVEELCHVLEIPLTRARQRELKALDAAALQGFIQHIKTERSWPAAPGGAPKRRAPRRR